jgi:hypothetical protein
MVRDRVGRASPGDSWAGLFLVTLAQTGVTAGTFEAGRTMQSVFV